MTRRLASTASTAGDGSLRIPSAHFDCLPRAAAAAAYSREGRDALPSIRAAIRVQRRLLGLRTYRLAGFAVGIRPAEGADVVAGVASALGRMAAGLMAHVEAV